mmetsp:Transcript_9985/g.15344  ORF Transcript_9985/g.15344 Transcript_9985/m.15344 type:complete len:213 (-) Transcript_9985:593-1231(-)
MDTLPLNAGKENYKVSWSKVHVYYEQGINKRNSTVRHRGFDRRIPSITSFWRKIFGNDLHVLLGLFHLMQRITDTMNPKCDLYWEALVKLKQSFYKYMDEDFLLLITALKDGTLSKEGEKLRKVILEAPTVIYNLDLFLENYKNKSDDAGRYIFSRKTEEVIREQMKKVKHASDPPNFEMYQKIQPSGNTKHNLIKYQSLRPEYWVVLQMEM